MKTTELMQIVHLFHSFVGVHNQGFIMWGPWTLRILWIEFRGLWSWMGKNITSLFWLTSNWNSAFPSVTDVWNTVSLRRGSYASPNCQRAPGTKKVKNLSSNSRIWPFGNQISWSSSHFDCRHYSKVIPELQFSLSVKSAINTKRDNVLKLLT